MDQTTAFAYTLSAILQGVAALVAIAAVFAVFRLQLMERRRADALRQMATSLAWFREFFRPSDAHQFQFPKTLDYLWELFKEELDSKGESRSEDAKSAGPGGWQRVEPVIIPWLMSQQDPQKYTIDKLEGLLRVADQENNGTESPERQTPKVEDLKVFAGRIQRVRAATRRGKLLEDGIRSAKRSAWWPGLSGGLTIAYCAIVLPNLPRWCVQTCWPLVAVAVAGAIATVLLTIWAMHHILFETE